MVHYKLATQQLQVGLLSKETLNSLFFISIHSPEVKRLHHGGKAVSEKDDQCWKTDSVWLMD